jgi:hypothetical protein
LAILTNNHDNIPGLEGLFDGTDYDGKESMSVDPALALTSKPLPFNLKPPSSFSPVEMNHKTPKEEKVKSKKNLSGANSPPFAGPNEGSKSNNFSFESSPHNGVDSSANTLNSLESEDPDDGEAMDNNDNDDDDDDDDASVEPSPKRRKTMNKAEKKCVPTTLPVAPPLLPSIQNPSSAVVSTPCSSTSQVIAAPPVMTVTSNVAKMPSSMKMDSCCLVVLRFDRISLKEWNVTETKIYNFQEFLQQNQSATLYLVNEKLLFAADEVICHERKLKSKSALPSGMITLADELNSHNKSLITSWNKRDHVHLHSFLEKSFERNNYNLSLLDEWNQQNPFLSSSTSFTNASSVARGLLAYEMTIQVGIVIRKNSEIGLEEDCWRLIYLNDLLSFATKYSTFDAFLIAFFPQLIPVLAPLLAPSASKMVLMKYFSHHFTLPLQQPPIMNEKLSSYQTIGLLNEMTEMIFSR